MKLCTFCQEKVLGSELSWDYHHGSYTSLEQSASFVSEVDPFKRERCLFCSTLKQDIDEIAPTLKDEKRRDEWPVYRWSIRSLARIRESLETVVVTFREIATINDSQDGKKAKEMHDDSEENKEDMKPLPTRAFYLFPEEGGHLFFSISYFPKHLNLFLPIMLMSFSNAMAPRFIGSVFLL